MCKPMVQVCGGGLFRAGRQKCTGKFRDMGNGFVGELISDEEIDKWLQLDDFGYRQERQPPVFLWAPTGRGKNYFIMNSLREYAKRKGRRILYVSNRVALDYQQKQYLAKLTHHTFLWDGQDFDKLEDIESFNNMSIITYHKLVSRLYSHDKKDKEWLSSFSYLVLDECHFFYSDATYNAETCNILQKIPDVFRGSVRIYMSATFENVFEPIRYFEYCVDRSLSHDYNLLRYAYRFPRDYSSYTFWTFSKDAQIIDLARKATTRGKMLIFVQNKEMGRQLVKALSNNLSSDTQEEQKAHFIDSSSRRSEDLSERLLWETIKRHGQFDFPVLITTCVLDNGFSIKDPNLKSVVICAEEATEAVQELGRCRLEGDQHIDVFVQKMTRKRSAQLRRKCNYILDLFFAWYGESQEALVHNQFEEKGDPIRTAISLWHQKEDSRRNLIGLRRTEDGLKPFINDMAKWWALRVMEADQKYQALVATNPDIANSAFVLQWFDPDLDLTSKVPILAHDLDMADHAADIDKLIQLLIDAAKSRSSFQQDSSEELEFRDKFTELYKKAYPDDTATSRSKNRAPVFSFNMIRKRLSKQPELVAFRLEQVGSEWSLYKV